MDLDPHFGRFFFAKKINFLKSLRVQKCVLPHEVWTPKIVISLGKTLFFTKSTFFASKWKSMENTRKTRTNRLKINCFFWRRFLKDFEPTWLDFGLQVGPQERDPPRHFSKLRPRVVQHAPKSAPRASQERPRMPQERPKGAQERPKSSPRVPKSARRASLERPRGSQERPRVWEFRNMLRTGRHELQTFGRP